MNGIVKFLINCKNYIGFVAIVLGFLYATLAIILLDIFIFLSSTLLTFTTAMFLTIKGIDYFGHGSWEPSIVVFWVIVSSLALFALLLGFYFIKNRQQGRVLLSIVAGLLFG